MAPSLLGGGLVCKGAGGGWGSGAAVCVGVVVWRTEKRALGGGQKGGGIHSSIYIKIRLCGVRHKKRQVVDIVVVCMWALWYERVLLSVFLFQQGRGRPASIPTYSESLMGRRRGENPRGRKREGGTKRRGRRNGGGGAQRAQRARLFWRRPPPHEPATLAKNGKGGAAAATVRRASLPPQKGGRAAQCARGFPKQREARRRRQGGMRIGSVRARRAKRV